MKYSHLYYTNSNEFNRVKKKKKIVRRFAKLRVGERTYGIGAPPLSICARRLLWKSAKYNEEMSDFCRQNHVRRLAWAATCDPAIITLAKPRLLRCSLVLPSNANVRLQCSVSSYCFTPITDKC